jgi:predicted MFS family arabinose efflux permease
VSRRDQLALWVTYLNIVLYALCYQLQKPVEPFLVQTLAENANDADAVARKYGELQSFFSAIQTVGSPLVGILLDRAGIRFASASVFFASALSYTILAVATDINLLFYSKLPTALQHAFLVAQATAATSTAGDDSARAQALGRMTTAYTIGATIGPVLGGILADHGDLYIGARLAVFGSLLSVLLSVVFLPTVASSNNAPYRKEIRQRSFFDEVRHSFNMATRPILLPLLAVKVIAGLAVSIYSTALPILLTRDLKFDPATLGLSMSSSTFAVAVFGAVGMAPLTSQIGAPGMAKIGLLIRAFLGALTALVISQGTHARFPIPVNIMAISVLHGLASHMLATGLTTQTTGAVEQDEQGALLGLEHGLFSLARVGGPALGTSFLASGSSGFWPVANVCGAIDLALALALTLTTLERKSKEKGQ